MTTATAPAVEKRKKPWTKARVIDLIIDIFCFVIVGAASLTCILPFIHILAKSLSDNAYVVANRVILLPMSDAGINLDAYNKVFHDPTIMQSLWVTALVTVVFTAIGMFLTVCASYALTRPEFHGRKVFTFMIMFTMYFTAGTIPDYLLMNQLHMLDTIWCLILPLCFAPYNLLIMKNNFQGSIPESLIESAAWTVLPTSPFWQRSLCRCPNPSWQPSPCSMQLAVGMPTPMRCTTLNRMSRCARCSSNCIT